MGIRLTLNGKPEIAEAGSALSQLLLLKGLHLQRVAVELNGRVLPREEYASTLLKEGDLLEVVPFVGGG